MRKYIFYSGVRPWINEEKNHVEPRHNLCLQEKNDAKGAVRTLINKLLHAGTYFDSDSSVVSIILLLINKGI
jgi:hypothetical protein